MKTGDEKTFREKIIAGLELAMKRLIETKARNDEELVTMQGDKIVRVKAKDLLNKGIS